MNLRVLKKKSKQAAEFIEKFWPRPVANGSQFRAPKGESYHGEQITCHCPRARCECSYHPLKGTFMYGGMQGYWEPEWEEKTALHVLRDCLFWMDKPAAATVREWARMLRIADITQKMIDDHAVWIREGQV